MVTVLSATGLMLFVCTVAVRSSALVILLCLTGESLLENQKFPAVTKSRDILIQMRKKAIVTNIPRPP